MTEPRHCDICRNDIISAGDSTFRMHIEDHLAENYTFFDLVPERYAAYAKEWNVSVTDLWNSGYKRFKDREQRLEADRRFQQEDPNGWARYWKACLEERKRPSQVQPMVFRQWKACLEETKRRAEELSWVGKNRAAISVAIRDGWRDGMMGPASSSCECGATACKSNIHSDWCPAK